MPNALVVVFDRLGSNWLGPYGNSWIGTPGWNRLAARSLLMETALIDSPCLETVYGSYWQGRHALAGKAEQELHNLPAQASAAAIDTHLVTDDPTIADSRIAQDFQQRSILPPADTDQPASALEETHMARLFAIALEALEQAEPPFLIWVHARAMQGPWDAPYALRARYADQEDPEPPSFVPPPCEQLPPGYDPDRLLGLQHAYAGQVAVSDFCLDVLLDAFWASPHANTTTLLATAPRGYPLGEHLRVGPGNDALYGESIQVPWLLHDPSGAGACARTHQIVQSPDMYATLLEILGLPAPSEPVWSTSLIPLVQDQDISGPWDRAVSTAGGHRAVRVPGWFLCETPNHPARLFVKPHDRWEVNDVANRCRDVIERMRYVVDEFQQAVEADRRELLTGLPPILIEGLE